MKLVIALVALVSANCYADMYRCPSQSGTVYQEQPCANGGSKIAIPESRTEPARGGAQEKLAKDKAYVDERIKIRAYEFDKSMSQARLQDCEAYAANLLVQADAVANGYQRGTPLTARDAANLQLDAQRRQNEVLSLQGKAAARRSQCDNMRREHDRQFQK